MTAVDRDTSPSTSNDRVLRTACTLDCPDGCSLEVTVRDGRIIKRKYFDYALHSSWSSKFAETNFR